MIKKLIEKNATLIFAILPLSIFSLIGFVAFCFAVKFPENVPLYAWVTIIIFAIMPLIVIYGLIFGFSISERQQKQISERQEKLFYDDKGITIEIPLFDKNCFISWQSIDAIIYYNYILSSDFTEHYQGYKLYLNAVPVYTKYEKQWWLNKLFPKDSQSKIMDIDNKTKHVLEIPKAVEKYLNSQVDISLNDPIKGALISSQAYQIKNKITTREKCKPSSNESEQIVFDKFSRSIVEIKKNYQ
ncbi:hypothetical protein [Flavobacterium sp. 3-210]